MTQSVVKLEKQQTGIYRAFDAVGILGTVIGAAGRWQAQKPNGQGVTQHKTRSEASRSLRRVNSNAVSGNG